jgi:ABC-type branched-subunit amino acid transport system substrate-binding protein
MPVISVSIAEEEVKSIGTQYLTGQLTAWNYYQTTPGSANDKFVKAYKAKFGADKPTSDPMEAAYVSVYLWKAMVEKAAVVRRGEGEGGRGRHHVRRTRGAGHDRRCHPAHLEDRRGSARSVTTV